MEKATRQEQSGQGEDGQQEEEGVETATLAEDGTDKEQEEKAQITESQGKQRQSKRTGGSGGKRLEPIKELTKIEPGIWRRLDYEKKKRHILSGLPTFLAKHLPPGKVRYVLRRIEEQPTSDCLRTLQPDNFKSFMNQI